MFGNDLLQFLYILDGRGPSLGSSSCQEFNLRKHNTSQAKSLSSLRAEDKLDQLQDGHEIRFKRVKMKKRRT